MDQSERSAAQFGAWDGVVSIIGLVFALLIHGASAAAVGLAGLGAAISATVSMASGEYESATSSRLGSAFAMGASTLIGSLLPVLPFLFLPKTTALLVAIALCVVVALWIGREKGGGAIGILRTVAVLAAAIGLTLAIVGPLPASA